MTKFDFTGWEAETDLGNADDREGVYFLTIREDGEEWAIIVHRETPEYPLDGPEADRKVEQAQQTVDALNAQRGENE